MAVNCVFPSKKQAESLGITEGQLRNILQEYTNSPELQSQFTEEEFVDSKLNGLPVIGVSNAQMQAWDEVYSATREFDSIEEYNEAASTAEAIFGKNAIGHRETSEGKHILSVANPYTESMVKERLEIKERAIANGTFMKAPNGNPTNLTERQWLQVRTKEFKDWFGDWEKVARSSKYRKSNDIPNSLTSATFQGVSVSDVKFDPDMAPDGGTRIVFLGDKYIGEIPVFESGDSIHMGGSIGAATQIEAEYRGKGYGKKAHIALANIAKAEGKTLYSDDSNSDAEDALWKSLVKDGIAEIVDERPKVGNWNHTTYKIINDNLPNAESITFGDENVSKVVDENGEPLVVYTGVPTRGISEFRLDTENRASLTSVLKKGIYFSDKSTVFNVPNTLLSTASTTLCSIKGTCLCAAAIITILGLYASNT